ncbi:MAG TPA: phosphatase PAP2 family protein [Patescibacteria group bacterium]|nr:phosphatase PAP2 family protein [Patescibacteria group bacterium]
MPKRNVVFFLSGVGFFLLFVLFSYLVHKGIFTQLDFNTTVRLQDNIPTRLDDFFSSFSVIGSFEPMIIILVIILVLWRKIVAGVALLSGFIIFHFFELFGKYFVNHPPPPEFMLRTKRLVQFPQFYVREQFSYPSGHSGRTIFLAVVILFIIWQSKRFSQPMKWGITGIVILFVVIMLVSRIYLGEHWTTDIIGGGLLGAALSLSGLALYTEKKTS